MGPGGYSTGSASLSQPPSPEVGKLIRKTRPEGYFHSLLVVPFSPPSQKRRAGLEVQMSAVKSFVLPTWGLQSQSGQVAHSSSTLCPKWAFTPSRPLLSAQVG